MESFGWQPSSAGGEKKIMDDEDKRMEAAAIDEASQSLRKELATQE